MWWFLERTPYGAIMKAGAHDSEMVRALGIDLGRMRSLVFCARHRDGRRGRA